VCMCGRRVAGDKSRGCGRRESLQPFKHGALNSLHRLPSEPSRGLILSIPILTGLKFIVKGVSLSTLLSTLRGLVVLLQSQQPKGARRTPGGVLIYL